eukprot:COSAG01_NODE_636_length_14635_cov_18.612617_8_plen_797_part_00
MFSFLYRLFTKQPTAQNLSLVPPPMLKQYPAEARHPFKKAFYHHYLKQGLRNQEHITKKQNWRWPYWAKAQLDPTQPLYSVSEAPFILHNHHCRNWRHLSLAGQAPSLCIDPKGSICVVPFKWSIEFWVIYENRLICPSDWQQVHQQASIAQAQQIYKHPHFELQVSTIMYEKDKQKCFADIELSFQNLCTTPIEASIFVAIRPYTPVGISGIKSINYLKSQAFMVDQQLALGLKDQPDNVLCLSAKDGDVSERLRDWEMILKTQCSEHMASAAAEYRFSLLSQEVKTTSFSVPLTSTPRFSFFWNPKLNHMQQIKLKNSLAHLKSQDHASLISQHEQHLKDFLSPMTKINLPHASSNQIFDSVIKQLLSFMGPGHLLSDSIEPNSQHLKSSLALYQSLLVFSGKPWVMPAINSLLQQKWHTLLPSLETNPSAYCRLYCFLQEFADYHHMTDAYALLKKKGFLIIKKLLKKRIKKDTNHPDWVGLLRESSSCEQSHEPAYYLWDNLWALSMLKNILKLPKLSPKEKTWLSLQAESLTASIQHLSRRCGLLNQQAPYLPVSTNTHQDVRTLDVLYTAVFQNIYKASDPIIGHSINKLAPYFRDAPLLYTPLRHGYDMSRQFMLLRLYIACKNPKAFSLLTRLTGLSSNQHTWPEVLNPQSLGGAFGQGHCAYSAALYAQCVYDVLIHEADDNIYLFPFLPPDWLPKANRPLSIEGLLCKFGSINLYLSYTSSNKVTLSITPNFSTPPKQLLISFPYLITQMESETGLEIINKKEISIQKTSTQIIFHLDMPVLEPVL